MERKQGVLIEKNWLKMVKTAANDKPEVAPREYAMKMHISSQ